MKSLINKTAQLLPIHPPSLLCTLVPPTHRAKRQRCKMNLSARDYAEQCCWPPLLSHLVRWHHQSTQLLLLREK